MKARINRRSFSGGMGGAVEWRLLSEGELEGGFLLLAFEELAETMIGVGVLSVALVFVAHGVEDSAFKDGGFYLLVLGG